MVTAAVHERRITSTAEVAAARDAIRSFAVGHGLADRGDDVALVVSELITNGLEHGAEQAVLLVATRADHRLEVAVQSQIDAERPEVASTPPAPTESRGRGLYIARELSDSFAFAEDADTVRVVCTFELA